ncbi:hypothetical protein LINPERPRIM_LOCUS18598 [Linum perenne]
MASFTFSLRILLISTAVLSGALLLKSSVPLVRDFSVYQAPVLWSSLSSWLRPPYLYVIINCIIITIAASSRFHHCGGEQQEERLKAVEAVVRPPVDRFDFDEQVKVSSDPVVVLPSRSFGGVEMEAEAVVEVADVDSVFVDKAVTVSSSSGGGGGLGSSVSVFERDDDEDEFVISRSAWIPPTKKRIESPEKLLELLSPAEKPLVSARFGHRKPVKVTPEGGRKLKVSKPKRHDTLENTWKMITEGRPMPLNRHLKKSDTWETNHSRQISVDDAVDELPSSLDPPAVKKSETFKDRTNFPPLTPASGKLKKEPSLSQDELNRRVEAFINKFNEEMRMQRQESINRYKEMVSR